MSSQSGDAADEGRDDAVIVARASDGRIVRANEAAARLTGHSVEELLALRLDELVDSSSRPRAEGEAPRFPYLRRRDGAALPIALGDWSLQGGELRTVLRDVREQKATAAALREAESEMRALFGAMTDLVFVIDRSGRHIRVGPTSPELLLRPASAVIGRTLHELFEPALADASLAAVHLALDGQVAVPFDYELVIRGERRWFSAQISPMNDERVVWVARDVTDRHRADASVRASEARYRLLFDDNPLAMMLFDEETLRILEVNHAATQQYGWSRDAFTQLTVADLRPPETLHELRRAIDDSPAAGRIPGISWHRRRDGTAFPVEITAYTVTVDGRRARLALTADVTERVRAERERAEAYHALATLVETAPLAIVALDARACVTMWNAAAERMFGYARAEVLGRPVDLIPPGREGERSFAERALAGPGESIANVATQRRRRDGTLVDVLLSTTAFTTADGRRNAVAFLADVTDRRQLEEQLRHAQKMEAVGRLAGGVAHDFNNLLTAIISHDELLLEQFAESDPVYGDLLEIRAVAQRAAALTRQLLAFSRRQLLQPRTLDLAEVLASAESMLRRVMGEDVRLEVEAPAQGWLVRADPGQLEQVAMNLAVNARDAMPDGGSLFLGVRHTTITAGEAAARPEASPGEYVTMVARDTGVGMTAATRARVFEPFFTTKEAGKGTGLGLATVYGIVRQSGGFIEVESAPGRGATFLVHLPRWTGPEDAVPGAPSPPARPRGTGTILVVEDEDVVRSVAMRVLRANGYEVVEARTGREALDVLERGAPAIDLVLTDYVMPEMGGLELAERARGLGSPPRIVFMSGYTGDALAERGEPPPGSSFLEKPFSIEQLLAAVARALEAAPGSPPEPPAR